MTDTIQRYIDRIQQLEHFVNGMTTELHEVEQHLGIALGYPWYKDDQKNFPGATNEDGVCVGEHTPASLAIEAKEKIRTLTEYDKWYTN